MSEAPAGRVARVDLGVCTVLVDGGTERVHFRPDQSVAVGDYIEYDHGDPPRLVAVAPRRSEFSRSAAGRETRQQVVAANVDTLLFVHGLDSPVSVRRIERGLSLGYQSGAAPVVVLTKSDLAGDDLDLDSVVAEVRAVALAAPVHVVSATTGEGLDELRAYLRPGETIAFLGTSGAGKSTLVNRLAGAEVMATGAVRRDGKGRHTTTHRELIPLPGGAFLLDTPGMRELGLWDAAEGVQKAFADVDELAASCRFNDCSHTSEPGCELTAAVAEGRLAEDRFAAWVKLQSELRQQAMRTDPRLRAAELRRRKSLAKFVRDLPPKR